MSFDLNAAASVAENLARRAGVLLREAVQRPPTISYKGAVDLVTESDRACEALIVGGLRETYPDHAIVGEEGSNITAAPGHYSWYVDPLDGTTNFAHGVPHFSISIGLAAPDGTPAVGIVYDPIRDELFRAVQGQGATLNSKPIQVSSTAELSRAYLGTGFPRDRWTNPHNNSEEFCNFLLRSHGVARLGSAALDLCYVAAGRFEGFWETRVNPWDVTAGMLCVTEAGGRISNYHGQLVPEDVYTGRQFIASNGLIHEEMVAVLVLGSAAPRPVQHEKTS